MDLTFSVVTPCYNANRWIRACVASVADQQGVSVQHIVQDGGSTDGTAEFLLADSRVEAESKPDKGMYDAINKGWAKCTGEFVLHLNADEELLPGALEAVGKFFRDNSAVDIVLAGVLICEPDGQLQCYRKPILPTLGILVTSHLPTLSCATFYRRSALASRKWLYDPSFRLISDVLLMIDLVRQRQRMATLNRYTSVFMMTGANMGLTQSANAKREYKHQMSTATKWQQLLRPVIRVLFLLRKLRQGHYHQGQLTYDIYVPNSESKRTSFVVAKPSGIYRPGKTHDAS